eukprot:15163787-Alexandrium_andersonii.AAC.1
MPASRAGLSQPGRQACPGRAPRPAPRRQSAYEGAAADRPGSPGTTPRCGPRRTSGRGRGRRG